MLRRSSPRAFILGVMILVLSGVSAGAQDQPLQVYSAPVFFDRPEFDSVVLVEFPFSLARDQFEFYQPDTGRGIYFARVFAQVTLFGRDGMAVDSANTYFSSAVQDPAEAKREGVRLFNSLALVVSPGVYSGRLKVIDAVSKNEGEAFFDRIAVELPEKRRLAIGGECLAHRIAYVGSGGGSEAELRSGYEVYCNPSGVFSTDDSLLYVYAEVYNLAVDTGDTSGFRTDWSIQAGSGAWRVLDSRVRTKPGRSAVIVKSFEIAGWQPGSYRLQMSVTDPTVEHQIAREWPFRIMAPQIDTFAEEEVVASETLESLPVEIQLRLIRYLVDPEQKAALERLTDVGRRSFLRQFWQDRDPDPTTPENEFRRDLYERYLYANDFFSIEEGKTDGWLSDRGRILMTYGTWDQRLDRFHPVNSYPYQIWRYYDLREGVTFVFVDEDGFGDYRLVHSNMPGEVYNSAWAEMLRLGLPDLD